MQPFSRVFELSALSLVLFSHFSVASAESELDLGFLRGVNSTPSVLKSGSLYPSGQYYVDVVVNQESLGKAPLTITPEEDAANALCLSADWMESVGVPIRLEGYADALDVAKRCYVLSKNPYTKVDFRYGSQSLVFSVPQSLVVSKTDPSLWDYGVPAARLKYNAYVARSSGQSTSAYAYGDLLLNAGRWVLSTNMNATRSSEGKAEFAARDATLSTALSQVKGDVLLGKSWTRTSLFNDVGFYGVALRSNSSMTPWEARGYAPLITGVASSASRITIKQGGYTVYSRMVPAGPYRLDDIRAVGNGDLVMTVEDEGGRKTVTTYPVTTLPTLLRPGEVEYNIATGRKAGNNKIRDPFSEGERGIFWMGSLGYGFSDITLNAASILHDKYQASAASVTRSMGTLGAFSVGGNVSWAKYDSGIRKNGYSVSAQYAKSFSDSSNLHLMAFRYQSKGYVEFADFYSTDSNTRYNKKSRYEARFSQRLGGSNLALTGWTEDYWWQDGRASGGDATISTTVFDNVSVSLSGNYNRQPYLDRPDYSMSLSFNIPFNMGGTRHYSNTSFNYTRRGESSLNTSVGANPTDRLNYNLNTTLSEKGERSIGGGLNYGFDAMSTGLMLSQSPRTTTVSGSVNGMILGAEESGFLMTKDNNDTVGVVRIPDVAGVRVNGSVPTNGKGYTVVNLSDYSLNRVSVDMDNVPDSLELRTTSYNVVPTEKAVVYREFGADYVKRYILQVKDRNGKIINGGSARTEKGVDAGFIAGNGVLLMNMLTAPSQVNVGLGEGAHCRFSMQGIEANTNKVQEVRCE